jgi:hypothetical protein
MQQHWRASDVGILAAHNGATDFQFLAVEVVCRSELTLFSLVKWITVWTLWTVLSNTRPFNLKQVRGGLISPPQDLFFLQHHPERIKLPAAWGALLWTLVLVRSDLTQSVALIMKHWLMHLVVL